MTNPEKYDTHLSTQLLVAGFAGLAFVMYRYRNRILKRFLNKFRVLSRDEIQIVDTDISCGNAIANIKQFCVKHKVLGFDCEWVTIDGSRRPVALIQLASTNGHCTLFRLSKIQHVPKELKILLEDPSIYKVGVAPIDDAKYLWNDYAVKVEGVLDLRHLAVLAKEKPEGLSGLAASHLNIKMDKHWKIRCSDWEADTLTDKQLIYAANDASVAVKLFEFFINKLLRQNAGLNFFKSINSVEWKNVEIIFKNFVNMRFSNKLPLTGKMDFDNLITKQQKESLNVKSQRRSYTTCISKQVYENCYMKTQDGEILCTCDRKKAEWYVEKKLAEIICEEPFTIQLNFEPAGRSVGSVGMFYQMPRKKMCVVCGSDKSYIKKNVIPREYRRLFPPVMKDHSCHDVLLMCTNCHQLSNIRDQTMRHHLAKLCNAPITDSGQPKVIEDPRVKKVKSAARALLVASSKHNIPAIRQEKLEHIILEYFPTAGIISNELLMAACDLSYRSENSLYESHGQIVVDYFINKSNGLLELEKMWRQHFLSSMEPKYMPEFWSIDHTKTRLEIRVTEGRVNEEDLQIAGLIINNPCI